MLALIALLLSVVFTDSQTDHILQLISTALSLIGLVIPTMLLYFQKKNKLEISNKIDENSAVNDAALTAANGHNEKIAELTEKIRQLEAAKR